MDGADLQGIVDKIRSSQELARWKILRQFRNEQTPFNLLKNKLRDEVNRKRKIWRYAQNALIAAGEEPLDPDHEISELQQRTVRDALIDLSMGKIDRLDSLAKQIEEELAVPEGAAVEFRERVERLFNYLDEEEPQNKTFLKLLRKVLATPVYAALKEDPDDPTVGAIHRICLAIWNDLDTFGQYEMLGEKLMVNCDFQVHDPLTGGMIVDALIVSHEAARPYLNTNQCLSEKFRYSLTNPVVSLKHALSEDGVIGRNLAKVGIGSFESQVAIASFPSLQGYTDIELSEKKGIVKNCYGGVSTLGGEVSPEFLAALQAIENNRYAEQPDPAIPEAILYTNFLNFGERGIENSRSVALMKLNQQFPLSFLGVTLSKDSVFYQNREERGWDGAEAFGSEMKRYLMSGSSYSLHGRADQDDGGFYFPGDHEKWRGLFDRIIDQANERFKEVPAELKLHASQSSLRGAYQEYVYSMLQPLLEVELLKRCKRPKPVILAIRAGKENIDRCDNENVKYLYTRLADDYFHEKRREGMDLIAGAFHTPPLLFSNCMVHTDRTPQTFAFLRYVDRDAFKEDRRKLLEKEDVKSFTFSLKY